MSFDSCLQGILFGISLVCVARDYRLHICHMTFTSCHTFVLSHPRALISLGLWEVIYAKIPLFPITM